MKRISICISITSPLLYQPLRSLAKRRLATIIILLTFVLLGIFFISCEPIIVSGPGTPTPTPTSGNNRPVTAITPSPQQGGNAPTLQITVSPYPANIPTCRFDRDYAFSLGVKQVCQFSGGVTILCEGDIDDSLGTIHDGLGSTKQIDIINKPAIIDARDNGTSCYYVAPNTLQQRIDGEADYAHQQGMTLVVWENGKLIKTL